MICIGGIFYERYNKFSRPERRDSHSSCHRQRKSLTGAELLSKNDVRMQGYV